MSRKEDRRATTAAERHRRRQAVLSTKFRRAKNQSQRVSAAADYVRSAMSDPEVTAAAANSTADQAIRKLVELADQLVTQTGGR
ncbi:hypothetical protein [Frankia sp. R82]|uniref:hypothetical protein n=1 Tax=Frankia sp. R82 TaxID=2950553 RepID=UPI002043A656|nr:hypothetical protein [Frankia sp. R82]MCM3884157.1 hypothetical protein [Frankia sp. R82]